jgi:hypothetical protein
MRESEDLRDGLRVDEIVDVDLASDISDSFAPGGATSSALSLGRHRRQRAKRRSP